MSGPYLVFILFLSILFIVIATAKFKLHPFLALIFASYFLAFAAFMPSDKIAGIITQGFGNTLTSIGIVIIAGVIIGTILEKSGAAIKMAETIIKFVGEKRPTIAMSIMGYIVSIPVFCDSGFIILSSLNKALAKKTKTSLVAMSIALSTGLYATHVLVPPTPGPIAAASNLQLNNLLLVILIGLLVAIPAMIAGNIFANKVASKYQANIDESISYEEVLKKYGKLPDAWKSFAPIVVPIILMALGSIAKFPGEPFGEGFFDKLFVFLGTPVNALLIGMFFAFLLLPNLSSETLNSWIVEAIKDSATILIITGAGGSLGNVIKEIGVGDYLGQTLSGLNLGMFLPFIIAAAIKTAQGSSTVSLITTSALMLPLLPSLGFTSDIAKALVVAAIGAGAMTVSHANDSYFWVVSQFGGIDVKTAYKTQTVATLIMGIVAIITVFILSLFLI
ncbi:predicted D-glycerate permease [Thermoanaerobacter thermohydrosulfuricus]|uniref:Gluconate transporter n=2 Tax=Thermoanaerobacter thermohydrosulfuricus TaxID=1516 RepID=M8DFQ5_THETY|nr:MULTISPECIES: GntP family permease [Thermoanaerobacter]EMT38837.1 gluconate transporter [Thermoanaerobacter thermohydrosulfuricus WC1]SDG00813.1 predicted D-glycerate permease [Thermoanaerobacter thermohydrosulfuricus]